MKAEQTLFFFSKSLFWFKYSKCFQKLTLSSMPVLIKPFISKISKLRFCFLISFLFSMQVLINLTRTAPKMQYKLSFQDITNIKTKHDNTIISALKAFGAKFINFCCNGFIISSIILASYCYLYLGKSISCCTNKFCFIEFICWIQ